VDGTAVPQLPWTEVANPYPPMEVLSADHLEAVHLTSLRILEELGMEVMSGRARDILAAAGALVDSATQTVRLDRGLVDKALATAPSSFVLEPRNPARRIVMGGNRINFGRRMFMTANAADGRAISAITAISSDSRNISTSFIYSEIRCARPSKCRRIPGI
jgi:trimethylamine:corrinoid methyltransferase-like protein